jgi:hypothetical protein
MKKYISPLALVVSLIALAWSNASWYLQRMEPAVLLKYARDDVRVTCMALQQALDGIPTLAKSHSRGEIEALFNTGSLDLRFNQDGKLVALQPKYRACP